MDDPLKIDGPPPVQPTEPAASQPTHALPPSPPTVEAALMNGDGGAPAVVWDPRAHARDMVLGSIPAVLLFTFCSLAFLVIELYILPHFGLTWMLPRSHPPAATPNQPFETPEATSLPAIILTRMFGVALLLGAFVGVCSAFSACFSSRVRAWLERQILWMAVRPMPAIHFIDVCAVIAVTLCMQRVFVIVLNSAFDFRSRGMLTPVSMIAQDMGMAVAIGAAVFMARFRARGPHGPQGFWTAWSSAGVSPKRPVWQDVLLGISCYPLMAWTVAMVALANKFLVNAPDRHFIIKEFAHHPPRVNAAVYLITATFGAAFFEETIFRGMLYNSMRRFLSGPLAAIGAAYIFAWVHGLKSDLIGLFVLGMVMTWLYDKTGRLIAGMAFHFTNNFVSMVMMLVLYNQ